MTIEGSTAVQPTCIGRVIQSISILTHGTHPGGDAIRAPKITDRGAPVPESQSISTDTAETVGTRAKRAITDTTVSRLAGLA